MVIFCVPYEEVEIIYKKKLNCVLVLKFSGKCSWRLAKCALECGVLYDKCYDISEEFAATVIRVDEVADLLIMLWQHNQNTQHLSHQNPWLDQTFRQSNLPPFFTKSWMLLNVTPRSFTNGLKGFAENFCLFLQDYHFSYSQISWYSNISSCPNSTVYEV